MDELDKIIRKIQDLMKLAQDNPNDEEGQTALLMAQRLLLKYNLSMETVQDRSNKDKDVIKESMTEKVSRMPWWKMKLHAILATNFRCKSIRTRNFVSRKTYLRFVGYEADVKFVAEIYEATLMYLDYRLKRIREQHMGVEYKNSYLLGFLSGIEERFKKQVESLNEFFQCFRFLLRLKRSMKNSRTLNDQDQTLRSIMRHTGQDMNMQLIQR